MRPCDVIPSGETTESKQNVSALAIDGAQLLEKEFHARDAVNNPRRLQLVIDTNEGPKNTGTASVVSHPEGSKRNELRRRVGCHRTLAFVKDKANATKRLLQVRRKGRDIFRGTPCGDVVQVRPDPDGRVTALEFQQRVVDANTEENGTEWIAPSVLSRPVISEAQSAEGRS